MKALSIKQPWASLIAHGIKDVENRTWKTHNRGKILIHASSGRIDHPYPFDYLTKEQKSIINNDFNRWKLYNRGDIIGEVDIVDCVLNHDSIWAEHMATHKCPDTGINILNKGQKYIWNWVLSNPVLYDEPILNVKGKLSFWDFDKSKTVNHGLES